MSTDDRFRYSKAQAARFDGQVTSIATRLRRMADEIEREGQPTRNFTNGSDRRPDYVQAASEVIHTVTWGVANLSLDGLVTTAADVHLARDLEAAEEARA